MTESTQTPSERPSKAKALFLEIRAPFLTASITPVLLGTAIAWGTMGTFLWDVFLLSLIAGVCLHIAANVSNDYFDHTSDNTGSDDINREFIRPFTGGSRMIQLGYLTPREVLAEAVVFFAIAGIIGVYLALTIDIFILVLGVIGAGSGFFYTAPPFRFVKRGIGEVFIGLNFGVLMTFGAYYVQAVQFVWEPIIASVPLALLIAGVLYINEFPDFNADRDAGKRTIVVRLGRKHAAKGYAFIILLTLAWNPIFILFQMIAFESLLALTILPLAYIGVKTALRCYDNPPQMVPSNVATIMMHLLIGIYMTVGYVLLGFSADLFIIALVSIVMFVIVLYYYRKLTTPPG
ncbi:MAG: 1,4-dihydroxy-2-naphthoate octaprenyltransferase [Candidatus Thorarchaeota archaeon]|nr:1,4-dihydroxy-2-naphthoate octaprenyltransferase [Candidatus Thorarchaeota archaeon]